MNLRTLSQLPADVPTAFGRVIRRPVADRSYLTWLDNRIFETWQEPVTVQVGEHTLTCTPIEAFSNRLIEMMRKELGIAEFDDKWVNPFEHTPYRSAKRDMDGAIDALETYKQVFMNKTPTKDEYFPSLARQRDFRFLGEPKPIKRVQFQPRFPDDIDRLMDAEDALAEQKRESRVKRVLEAARLCGIKEFCK